MTVHRWTDSEREFLRTEYPKRGAAWCAEFMGIEERKVRKMINRLKIKLEPELKQMIAKKAGQARATAIKKRLETEAKRRSRSKGAAPMTPKMWANLYSNVERI